MIPWLDIIIIIILLLFVLRGYKRGFLGALRGIVGSIIGLFVAWLTTPITVAWLEVTFGVQERLAELLYITLPSEFQDLILSLNSAISTVQELKSKIFSLQLPGNVTEYLQKNIDESTGSLQTGMPADMLIDITLGKFAHSIINAITFLIIFIVIANLIRAILGLFTGGGIGIFGVIDGLLGMSFSLAIGLLILTVIIGAIYPMIVVSSLEGNGKLFNRLFLESNLTNWLNFIYQQYILPWFA